MSTELIYSRPLPTRESDRDWNLFAPFWEATRNGELIVQECTTTNKKVWPPKFLSPFDTGAELKLVPIKTKGKVYSFNISYRSFIPYFEEEVPYGIVVVELEDGVRMLGNTVEMDPEDIQVGMEME